MVPGRFKDYISTPKRNGYRSIHTTVIHDEQMRIEIQIRTEEMHAKAEPGLAAHWAYKEGKEAAEAQHPWIDDLLEILEHAATAEELLEHTRIALYQDRSFAFTHAGQPGVASGRDFAGPAPPPGSCSSIPGWRCIRTGFSPSRRRAS